MNLENVKLLNLFGPEYIFKEMIEERIVSFNPSFVYVEVRNKPTGTDFPNTVCAVFVRTAHTDEDLEFLGYDGPTNVELGDYADTADLATLWFRCCEGKERMDALASAEDATDPEMRHFWMMLADPKSPAS